MAAIAIIEELVVVLHVREERHVFQTVTRLDRRSAPPTQAGRHPHVFGGWAKSQVA